MQVVRCLAQIHYSEGKPEMAQSETKRVYAEYRGKVVEEVRVESVNEGIEYDRLTIKFTDGSEFVAETCDPDGYQSWLEVKT